MEQADLEYPGVWYLLCLVWQSQMVLHQQTHCAQVVLELKCCCSQLLPWVHPSRPALCWSWWEVNSSYVGSGCVLPHPWDIPHELVHWDRATFPQHIPYFPIYPEFCDDLWRWLHGLEPYPQLPRLLLYCICDNCICGIHFLCLEALSPFWAHLACSLIFCMNLVVSGAVVVWGARPSVTPTGRWGCLLYMR